MNFNDLTADTQQWIKNAIGGGHPAQTVADTLVGAGYQPSIKVAVDQYVEALGNKGELARPHSSSVVATIAATQMLPDRDVQILMTLNAPRIIIFGNLLSPEECNGLIELSQARLKPSTVVNADTGAYDSHNARTSFGASFKRRENALISRIETRISNLMSIPESRGEPIQVLNYAQGAEYKPHFDYFDPKFKGNDKVLAMGGQRFATLVMYLNDVEAGGSTVFPEIGLDVLPRKGGAVFFSYASEDGWLDPLTLHGGSPVASGEKWIATKWLRLQDYTGPDA